MDALIREAQIFGAERARDRPDVQAAIIAFLQTPYDPVSDLDVAWARYNRIRAQWIRTALVPQQQWRRRPSKEPDFVRAYRAELMKGGY